MLSSCSQKSYTALYSENSILLGDEVKYHLSKNLLKLEIVYTLNEPRVQKNGLDQPLGLNGSQVTIEDPIKITKLLVADKSQTFFIKGKQLSDASFVNIGDKAKDVIIKDSVTISSENIEAVNKLQLAFLTDSNIEVGAYNSVLEIKNNISKIKTKDEAEFTLNLLQLYKDQSTRASKDFKPYIKKSKIKYTVIIDPSQLYSNPGNWSKLKGDKISHTIAPKHLFKDKAVLNDVITIEVQKPETASFSELINQKSLEGIVYRSPASGKVTVSLNKQALVKDSLAIAQLGTVKIIAVNDLKNQANSSVMLFKSKGENNLLVKNDKLFKLHNTAEYFDANETVETSQKVIRREYENKLKNIDLLILKLQELEKEL
ncbi:hypothetical protein CW732_18830 [Olleya sp. Bg11-27]|nr:hypothetical protein CW732_18830 [Olleya sp. Bg11-27]